MNDALVLAITWLNAVTNAVGCVLLAPVAVLPGWLSATVIAIVTGVLLLWIFKYTSHQRAIRRARNEVNANLLALKLFKESTRIALRAQGQILMGAFRLMVLALVPMLVMALPVCLLLGQLSLWYQARPLRVGEEAVVTLKLNPRIYHEPPTVDTVSLEPNAGVEVTLGPVRVLSKQEVCWQIKAREPGYHHLVFLIDGQRAEKQLAVGEEFLRVSLRRPGREWSDVLLHPWEPPFRQDDAVQRIEIDYPPRSGWTSGTDYWLIYWFVVSLIAGFLFRRALNVNV